MHLAERRGLVGDEVEDAVRDDDVAPTVTYRQRLEHPGPELDIQQSCQLGVSSRLGQHLRGHVHADHPTGRADESGGDQRIRAGP
jgi:hypothetical protein